MQAVTAQLALLERQEADHELLGPCRQLSAKVIPVLRQRV